MVHTIVPASKIQLNTTLPWLGRIPTLLSGTHRSFPLLILVYTSFLPSSFHTQLTFGTIAPFRELFTTKNDAIRSLVLTYLPLSTISGLIGGVVFGAKLPESLVREHEREHERDDHENRAQQFPVRTRLLM